MVWPGLVYLSQPTEYGTLYSLAELEAIHALCQEHGLTLYVDGARLAYALACPENDVTLGDLARLCDVFYVGGTKRGALLGEAVVLPRPERLPHFFAAVKQRGALFHGKRSAGRKSANGSPAKRFPLEKIAVSCMPASKTGHTLPIRMEPMCI